MNIDASTVEQVEQVEKVASEVIKVAKKSNWVKNMITESNNETHCIVRTSGLAGVFVYLCCQIWIVIHTGLFDSVNFSTGFGLLLGAISGGVKLKESTES